MDYLKEDERAISNDIAREGDLLLSRLIESRKRVEELEAKYAEIVDSLCSPSWLGRERHESVVALAKRLRDKQLKIVPTEYGTAEAGYCIRESGHSGPCNGFPRRDCAAALRGQG